MSERPDRELGRVGAAENTTIGSRFWPVNGRGDSGEKTVRRDGLHRGTVEFSIPSGEPRESYRKPVCRRGTTLVVKPTLLSVQSVNQGKVVLSSPLLSRVESQRIVIFLSFSSTFCFAKFMRNCVYECLTGRCSNELTKPKYSTVPLPTRSTKHHYCCSIIRDSTLLSLCFIKKYKKKKPRLYN